MKKKRFVKDFDYYIDEYMYNCRSRKLRPKTMQSYPTSKISMMQLLENSPADAAGSLDEKGNFL